MTDRNEHMNHTNENDSAENGADILERNVEQLLTRAHEPPRMELAARSRILDSLKGELATDEAPTRERWFQAPRFKLAAFAGACVILLAVLSQLPDDNTNKPVVHENAEVAPRWVTLEDGSRVLLNRNARITVLSKRHLMLTRGELLVDVTKGSGEFVIDAPEGRIVVLGTRFAVNSADGKTWAAVMRGKVRIENHHGKQTLRAGEQGSLRRDRAPTRRPAPRLSHLTSWAKAARREKVATTKPTRRGTLLARVPNWQQKQYPLPMRKLNVDVHVENQVARVAIDQTFFNEQQRQLEGVYRFPLPANASIARLAMYVAGKRMESAIVERQRAREIYEGIVYRRRDPALLEWMAGNLFKVRIFPLPARQEKRILLSYTQSVERLYDDYKIEVPIPEVDEPVGSVSYRVRLVGCADCQVSSTSHKVSVAPDGGDAIVTYERKNYVIGDDLLLSVRDKRKGASVAHHKVGNDNFWMVRAQPDFAKGSAKNNSKPRRWVILNDTSASRGPLERKAQAHIVGRLLREFDEDDQLNIVAFDTSARQLAKSFVRVGDADRVGISQFIDDQSKDGVGSTDMALALNTAVELLKAKGAADYQPHILYLGDGIITGGERTLKKLSAIVAGKATVVSVAVGDKMDSLVLRGLASATGGMFTTMNPGADLAWRSFDMIAALNTPRLVDVEASLLDGQGNVISEGSSYASSRQLSDGEEISVVAKLGGSLPAAMMLRGTRNGKPWSTKIALAGGTNSSAGYLARLWAQRRITALIGDGAKSHKKELITLGMKNFLMTPYTSLLVLENDKMYKQYKVKRDRKLGWAAYKVPQKIKVVRESVASTVTKNPNVALDAIMLRQRVQLVRRYNQHFRGDIGGIDFGRDTWADRGGDSTREITGEAESTLLTLRRAGFDEDATRIQGLKNGKRGLDLVLAARTTARPRGDWTVTRSKLGGLEKSKGLRQPSSGPVGGTVTVPTASGSAARVLIDGKMGSKGKKGRGRSVFASVFKESQNNRARNSGILGGLRGGRFSGRGGGGFGKYGYFGNSYSHAPYPVAFNRPNDGRLDDFTEFMPAMFVDQFDADLYELLRTPRANKRGTISDAARLVVERARKAIAARSYRSAGGSVFSVRQDGTFTIAAKTGSMLTENTLFDGSKLRQSYPELGLVVERDVSDGVALLLSHWAPFIVPDAKSLARWYDVSLAGPRTLRLRWGTTTDAASIEIALDDSDRIVQLSAVRGKKRAVAMKLSYANDAVTIERDGAKTTWLHDLSAKAPAWATNLPTSTDARIEMPLRRPAFWQAKAKKLTVGSMEWRHVQRQLLASYVAKRQVYKVQATVAALITAGAKLSRGEVVLASRAAALVPKLDVLEKSLGEWAKQDTLVEYLRTSWHYYRKRKRGAFRKLAKDANGSLVGMLSSYRDALDSAIYHKDPAEARKHIDTFVKGYKQPGLRYIIAYQFQSRFRYKKPLETAAVWKRVGEGTHADNAWARLAAYEIGRVLYSGRKYNEAAAHYEKLLKASKGIPRIDYTMINSFRQSSRGIAGWRMFWTKWRDKTLLKGEPLQLLALLQAARTSSQTGDYDRIVARLVSTDIKDPQVVVAVVGMLRSLNRNHQALAMLRPWVATKGKKTAIPALVEVASWITERQGRLVEAAAYLEQAMSAYYKKPVSLTIMRRDFTRMISLYTRLAQSARGTERKQHVRKALNSAAEWRLVDPDNVQIDRLAAALLFSVQRNHDAWRYLSTAIERHPMEGSSYKNVADGLEKEGRVKMAEPLWKRAVEVEPTNPTWLLRHAQALFALGKSVEANAQVDKILAKKWHNRFFRVTSRAKNLKRLYTR